MRLSRDKIQRMINAEGGSSSGGGGGSDIAGGVTQAWVNQNYVSIEFFRKVFKVWAAGETSSDPDVEIMPNDITTTVKDIQAQAGLWTEAFLSALGRGSGGGTGGATTLDQLDDVVITSPTNGQALIYNATTQMWVNGTIQSGTDMATVWSALAAATNEQINASHLSGVLADYVTTTSLQTILGDYLTQTAADQRYITIAYFDRLFRAYNGDTFVSHNDTTSTIDNIKAMFGFWTDLYISALGRNSAATGLGLDNLTDVTINTPTDGQVLQYNATSIKWENATIQTVVALSGLTDVLLTSPSANQFLMYDVVTGKWINYDLKTINGQSLFGSGDISVGGGASGNYLPLTGGTISGGNNFRPLIVGGTYSVVTEIGIKNGNTVYSGFGYNNGRTFMGIEEVSQYPKIALQHSDGAMIYSPNNFTSTRMKVTADDENALYLYNLNKNIAAIMITNRNGQNALRVGTFTEHAFIYNPLSGCEIELINTGGNDSIAFYNGSVKHVILHGGNYSSYALPLTGGTINGGNNFRPLIVTGTYSYVTEIGVGNNGTIYSGFGYNNGYTFMGVENDGYYPKIALRHSDRAMIYSPNNFASIVWYVDKNGSMVASGAVTALSDARHKTVINNVELSVEDVARMPAVVYRWNDRREDKELHVGSIAQDWQSVLPEVVLKANDDEGTLSMQYGVAALVSAITIARKVVDHERRIKKIERWADIVDFEERDE